MHSFRVTYRNKETGTIKTVVMKGTNSSAIVERFYETFPGFYIMQVLPPLTPLPLRKSYEL